MYCVYFYIPVVLRSEVLKRHGQAYKKYTEERRMCMNKTINLQDVFLNQCRKERIVVTIILTNGFQFKGMVRGFDSYVAIFDCDGKQQLVYKHAISTIIPAKSVSILDASEKSE